MSFVTGIINDFFKPSIHGDKLVVGTPRHEGETGYRDIYHESGGNTLSIRVGSLK